jgi:hypothetical protein
MSAMLTRRIAIGALVVAAAAGVTVWWQAQSPLISRHPAAVFPRTVDLGAQKFGDIVTGTIRVSNQGGSPLELSQFRTSCSCAGVEVLDGDRWRGIETARIAPTDGIELRVRISVEAWPGMGQMVYVMFATNDPERRSALVEVTIPYVTSDAFVDPAAVIFGVLRTGETARRTVTVYDCGAAGRQVARVACRHPDLFEVRLLPPDPTLPKIDHPYAGQPVGQIELTLRTDQPGAIVSELEIEMADAQTFPCRIPISGEVIGPVEVYPPTLFLPKVVSGRVTNSATVQLTSRSGEPITPSIEHVPDGLAAEIVESGGDSAVLRVTARDQAADASAAVRRSTIRVRVQAPAAATTVEVPVSFP